jgi:4-hydroxy-3-methylbut-2-enyl diphosphate reductase
LARQVDVLLVVGAQNSSNSNRLREIGEEMAVPSYLIDDAQSIDPAWLDGAATVGLTAGASAPEELVQAVVARLRRMERVDLQLQDGEVEGVQFKLPAELTTPAQ